MSEKLSAIQEALEESHDHSVKEGKWSTVADVKRFELDTNLTNLRRLVKQGAASEKIVNGSPVKLFKPSRAGAGAGSNISGDDGGKDRNGGKKPGRDGRKDGERNKGKDKTSGRKTGGRKTSGRKTDKPNGDKPGKTDKSSKDWKKTEPGDAVKNVVGMGVTTLLMGGMGSSIGRAATPGMSPSIMSVSRM